MLLNAGTFSNKLLLGGSLETITGIYNKYINSNISNINIIFQCILITLK